MNLVSMAMNFITPAILGRIASALGVDSKIAQMAIGAALPTILGSIVGKSSSPSGLSQLTSMLGQTDMGMLSNLAGMIGGSDQSKLVNSGSSMLGSLLGNSAVGSLAGAVGKFAGIGEGPTKSLLGMLAPVAMGTIAQQQKSNNLDGAGLARMLAGQKDNIAAAIPSGFGDLLKGSGLLDGISSGSSMGSTVRNAASTATAGASKAAYEATDHARGAVQNAGHAATASTGLPSWLTWGALLAALLAGWYLLGPGSGRRIAAPPTQIMYNNVNVASQVNGMYDGLKTTLGGIRDVASAQQALPRLQDSIKTLDGLQTLSGSMPAATRGDLASLIGSYVPHVVSLAKTTLDIPGVGGVAKPVLDQIVGKMQALAR